MIGQPVVLYRKEQIQRDAENIEKGQNTSVLAAIFFKIQAEVGRKKGCGGRGPTYKQIIFFINRDSEDIPQRV